MYDMLYTRIEYYYYCGLYAQVILVQVSMRNTIQGDVVFIDRCSFYTGDQHCGVTYED